MKSRGALLLVPLLVVAACTRGPAVEDGWTTHVVVDTDMGTDDVMSLLYLLRRDDVTIDAVTVVGDGLAHCAPAVVNARSLLTLGGSPQTPVACASEHPLSGERAFPDEWRTFSDDLDRLDLPIPSGAPYLGSAVDLLRRSLTGDAMLVTLGPLTNVAAALREDPALADRISRMVSMAGAVEAPGNAPGGVAEYNVWIDPVAAHEVIEAVPVTLVPLDATNQVPATPFFLEALARHLITPEAQAAATLLDGNQQIAEGSYYFWDPLATVLAVEPDLGSFDELRVLLEVSQTQTSGWISSWEQGLPVRVATGADALGFEREYLSTLAGEPVTDLRPHPDLSVTFDGDSCAVDGVVVEPGALVVAFRNASAAPASAVLGALEGLTYQELRSFIGPAGSSATEAPEGFADLALLVAAEGGSSMQRADVPPERSLVVGCLLQGEGAASVWLSPELTVRR